MLPGEMESKSVDKNEDESKIAAINVGTRESQLALIQTNLVIAKLQEFYANNPDRLHRLAHPKTQEKLDKLHFNVVPMTTKGDQILETPLHALVKNKDSKSLFTKELEKALLDGQVDFIVHSLKDLPTTLPDGCVIGAVMKRDSPDDIIVLKKSLKNRIDPLDLLFGGNKVTTEPGMKVGTSSLRRIAMLKRYNPNLDCMDIRGNLNTRLGKLDSDEGEFAAIILARAGLDRMGWSDRASCLLSPENNTSLSDWCYAVGQGAIAVECRSNDRHILDILSPITDIQTTYEVIAERCLMKQIGGGCSAPLGVRSKWTYERDRKVLHLESIFLSLDGKTIIKSKGQADLPSKLDIDTELNPLDLLTGIDVSAMDRLNSCGIKKDAARCSNLGIEVANKMINSGCLTLMGCKE